MMFPTGRKSRASVGGTGLAACGNHGNTGWKACATIGSKACATGFTLVEVCLSIGLLVLLMTVAVMAFGPWQQHSALPEGMQRFATVLRACQAAAAANGCRIRVTFAPQEGPDGSSSAALVKVEWEPQPLAQPGVFQAYQGWLPGYQELEKMVRVVGCNLTGPSAYQPAGQGSQDQTPPVMFFPDGSSDWAQVSLASAYPSDTRRARVELNGTTGTIAATLYADDQYQQAVRQ